jgi:hypothetical protein
MKVVLFINVVKFIWYNYVVHVINNPFFPPTGFREKKKNYFIFTSIYSALCKFMSDKAVYNDIQADGVKVENYIN